MLNPNLPKYLAIAEWMKENIYNNTFKAGEKLISENKLCQKFEISRQTARQAIAVLEEEGLVIKKQGSGTYINPISLKARLNTKTIALILPELSNDQTPTMLTEMEDLFSTAGYQLTIRLTHHQVTREREHLLALLNADIAGLIVEGTKSALPNPNLDLYQEFLTHHIPLLFIHNYYPGLPCHFIMTDDTACGQLATRHLIQQGHQKIGGLFQFNTLKGNFFYKGFLTEMYDHHLGVDEKHLIWYGTETTEHLFSQGNLSNLLDTLRRFTAILCDSEEVALKLIQHLTNETSLNVPNDLSLVTLGNTKLSQLATPPLTSIDPGRPTIGKLAAESLIQQIEDQETMINHICQPTLIPRQSVKHLLDK